MTENKRINPGVNLQGVRVLVTGANGFIGRPLVAGLIDAGAKVTVLLRAAHGRGYFTSLGADVVVCKLVPGPALERALADQDMVFHFAYDVRASGADNLAAFSALYEGALRCGITRFVHASSIVVYDDWPNGQITETSAISTGDGGDYRQTKIAMERRLLEGDIPVAILQPTIVYGPGSPLWSTAPQAALRRGPVVLPDPVGICPAVHVDDVVTAALQAAALPDLGQERFIITGPDAPTWADFYQGHARLIGTGSIKLVPVARLQAEIPMPPETGGQSGPSVAARISATLRRLLGSRRFEQVIGFLRSRKSGTGPVYPDPHMLALYGAMPDVSSACAQSRLGYDPRIDLGIGLSADRAAG